MKRESEQMKRLLEMRERRVAILRDLEQRVAQEKFGLTVLDEAIAASRGEQVAAPVAARKRNTKKTVMEIINSADGGVAASDVVEKAAAKGHQLKVRSVSSLLSKLKADGVLTFDGERYHVVRGAPNSGPTTTGTTILTGGSAVPKKFNIV